jgi:hypothetical protein
MSLRALARIRTTKAKKLGKLQQAKTRLEGELTHMAPNTVYYAPGLVSCFFCVLSAPCFRSLMTVGISRSLASGSFAFLPFVSPSG